MIKRDSNAKFIQVGGGIFWGQVYCLCSGKWSSWEKWNNKQYNDILEKQQQIPVLITIAYENKRQWWMFKDKIYWGDESYSEEEMHALIIERVEKEKIKLKRAITRMNNNVSLSNLREPIPDDVKIFVWQRDKGCCVKCGSQENLEFDHIIPVARGGNNTARNIQLLCERCNRSKGANLI